MKNFKTFRKENRGKIILFYIVTLVSIIGITLTMFLSKTNVHLTSTYFWKSYPEVVITEEDMNEINDTFGSDNVTQVKLTHATVDYQIRAIESNFIKNGVPVNSYDYSTLTHVEKVELLYGSVWDKGETDKVIVIDEDTAVEEFGAPNCIGQYLKIEDDQWRIVGVVTNTTARESYYRQFMRFNPDANISLTNLDSYVYVPYSFHNYENFPQTSLRYNAFIVNSEKVLSSKKDVNQVLDITVDGDNIMTYHDSDRYMIIGYTTPYDFISRNYSMILYIIGILIVDTIIVYTIYRYKLSKSLFNVRIKEYKEEYEDALFDLTVPEHATNFVANPEKILNLHNDPTQETVLYTLFNNEELVGTCLIRINPDYNNIFIWHYFVDQAHTNKGIGQNAIYKILSNLKSFPFDTVITTIKKDNQNAQKFFENVGFIPYSEEEDEVNLKRKN